MPSFQDWVWDQLLLEQARIECDHVGARAHVRGGARRSLPRPWWKTRRLLAIAAIAVACAGGGLALASALEDPRISPQQWVEGKRVRPEPAITPEQAGHLGILRRARTPTDTLLPWDAYAATHSPMAANGVNPLLSRRAIGVSEGGAWLIPGKGMICLESANAAGIRQALQTMPAGASAPRETAHVRGALGNTACATNAEANRGFSAGTAGSAGAPGLTATAGIVPDGVESVTVTLSGGGEVKLPVHENVYMGEVRGWPASVSFLGSHGRVTLSNGPVAPAPILAAQPRRHGVPTRRDLYTPLHLALKMRGHAIVAAELQFRAPLALTPGHGGYETDEYCGVDVTSGTIRGAIARGSSVAQRVMPWGWAAGRCATIYKVKVFYRPDALPGGRAGSPSESTVLVGSLTRHKPPGVRVAYHLCLPPQRAAECQHTWPIG